MPFVRTALLCLLFSIPNTFAEPSRALTSGEIHLALRKLNVLGTVLYVAAHPDDENTRLLSYLASERLLRTGYLSLNRGEGGQNLIGPELGPLLGVIRTQELLLAREIDGAEQFFTRAIDFGYSKSSEESLEKWGHEETLADIVRIIRKFQPDVIVTRFTPTIGGHGHHLASAQLAMEAWAAAGDSTRFPEQIRELKPWQARRVYWNAWRPEEREDSASLLGGVDAGIFNPLLGKSYTEIAAESRNSHKSQGFGTIPLRGMAEEKFQYLAGDSVAGDLFADVDVGWSRVAVSQGIPALVDSVVASYDFNHPEKSLPQVLKIHHRLSALPASHWSRLKLDETEKIIAAMLGLWVQAAADAPSIAAGDSFSLKFTAVARALSGWTLEKVTLPAPQSGGKGQARDTLLNVSLEKNKPYELTAPVRIPKNAEPTHPQWLRQEPQSERYRIDKAENIGMPQDPPALSVEWVLRQGNIRIRGQTPVEYVYLDKVHGEVYEPFLISPPAVVNFVEGISLFSGEGAREVAMTVTALSEGVKGRLRLNLPKDWKTAPAYHDFTMTEKGEQKPFVFSVTPPKGETRITAKAELIIGGKTVGRSRVEVAYDHIPKQTLFFPAEADWVKADIKTGGEHIGYLMGAGDAVPENLRQLGYRVTLLASADLDGDLTRFDAIVAGIRAFNVRNDLVARRKRVMDYVAQGGRFIVQYNVSMSLLTEDQGPYPFKLGRGRITVEEAPLEILDPSHPFFTQPNRITPKDFDGWVQERGLYFAETWDKAYQPLLRGNDPGEDPQEGMLLFARHGQGAYVYTGLSFFRQLPAAVPGAYRLFANLLSAQLEPEAKNPTEKKPK